MNAAVKEINLEAPSLDMIIRGAAIVSIFTTRGLVLKDYIERIVFVAMGHHDKEILAWASEEVKQGYLKVTPADFLRIIVDHAKEIIQTAVHREIQEERILRNKENQDILRNPPAAGTVGEIAEKYGISKAQVRKWRAEGILDEKLQELGNDTNQPG